MIQNHQFSDLCRIGYITGASDITQMGNMPRGPHGQQRFAGRPAGTNYSILPIFGVIDHSMLIIRDVRTWYEFFFEIEHEKKKG